MRSNQRPVTVTLVDAGQYSGQFPSKLLDFQKWIKDLIKQIPEEYRDSARFELSAYEEYDTPYAKLVVTYDRPETAEEEAARLAEERKWKERREARDREEYERLRSKFGDKP